MQDGERLREVANDCVHCGFCLPACPTYQLWAEEMDSPRGRIYLVNQILDGAELTPAAAEHFDRCLGCMACMTACPSGVQYDQLIEAARVWTEEARPVLPAAPDAPAGKQRVRDRAVRAAIFALFPYPRRLRAATLPLRAAQRTGLDRPLARSSLPGRLSPALGAALRLGASGAGRFGASGAGRFGASGARRLAPPASAAARLPERVAARGPRRAVVGMLTGCVQSVFFPGVNAATARVLALEGCDVIIPRGQGCCGALSLHSGREAEAAAFAQRTIEAFEQAGVDAVVVNSAGCGSAMKEYERLLDGSDWAGRAAALSVRVRDFSEFLAELGPGAERHPLPVTAAYHDACHLGHAQRITRQPRELLRSIPDLRLVELADAGTCCGSAGVYNLLQPEAAGELGARKAQAVLDAAAPLLISANPGCSLQIAAALVDRGEHIAVAHIAEILDASLRGLPPPALG
jgi:glycolate oxidase iron-sulfur subunit